MTFNIKLDSSIAYCAAEAPPSYLQLFGGKEETDGWRRLRLRLGGGREGGGGGGRNRHLRFQNLLPTDQNSAYKCGKGLYWRGGRGYF